MWLFCYHSDPFCVSNLMLLSCNPTEDSVIKYRIDIGYSLIHLLLLWITAKRHRLLLKGVTYGLVLCLWINGPQRWFSLHWLYIQHENLFTQELVFYTGVLHMKCMCMNRLGVPLFWQGMDYECFCLCVNRLWARVVVSEDGRLFQCFWRQWPFWQYMVRSLSFTANSTWVWNSSSKREEVCCFI